MENLTFVDEKLCVLPVELEEERFAIDMGISKLFLNSIAYDRSVHFFVSAIPLITSVTLHQSLTYVLNLLQKNLQCYDIGILSLKQVREINRLGKNVGFCIKNTWTSTNYYDCRGKVEGYVSLVNGHASVDWGEQLTDLYVYFAFEPGNEKPIFIG